MKSSIAVIMNVLLVIVLAAGFLAAIPPAPIQAANLAWSTLPKPVVTQGTNANVFALTPDGQTMFLYTASSASGDTGKLYKSSDAGLTWSSNGLGVGLGNGITKLVVNQTNSNELLATNGVGVWRSSNAGINWYDTTPVGVSLITGIDNVINGNGGVSLLFSSPSGVYLYSTDTGFWLTTLSAPMAFGWSTPGGTPYGVAFSPNYTNDSTLFALIDTGSYLVVRSFIVNGNGWNGDIADSTPITGTAAPAYISTPAYVSFAFPTTGFTPGSSSTGKIFVSYSNGSTGYVMRVNTKTQNASRTLTSTVTDLQIGSIAPSSIAFKGAYNTGTLAVGLVNDPTVYSVTGVGVATSNFSWNASAQSPYATTSVNPVTKVAFNPVSTALYAGTAGANGSALSVSADCISFSGMAFISVSSFANVSLPNGGRTGVGAATEWQKMRDNMGTTATADDVYLYFKSIDSGATWKLVFVSFAISYSVYLSPSYATDSTIYLFASALNKFIKSTDGGATWNLVNMVGGLSANAFAPIDGTNYWVATPAGIRNSSSPITIYLDGYSPIAIFNFPGALVVWTSAGEWFASPDSGLSFTPFGANAAIANGMNSIFTFKFDGVHWTLYMLDGGGNIQSRTISDGSTWSIYKSAASLAAGGFSGSITTMTVSGNGVWYFTSNSNPAGQIWRSTDMVTFEPVANTTAANIGSLISTLVSLPVSGSLTSLFIAIAGAISTNNYANTWLTFADSMLVAPQIIQPANNSSAPCNLDVSWNPVADAQAYSVQISGDSAFSNLAAQATTALTTWSPLGLTPGNVYYIRVRVATGNPLSSLWSQPVAFTATGAIPRITLISPNGWEKWQIGNSENITWLSTGVTGNVNILLSRDKGISWSAIIANTPNDGVQQWAVNSSPSVRTRIKVVSVDTPTVFDSSDFDFSITDPNLTWSALPKPVVTVGTEATVYDITANGTTFYLYSNGTDKKLYKSTDTGLTWISTGLGSNLNGNSVTKIVINNANSQELLAMNGAHVWRSSDAGQNWYDITPAGVTAVTGIDEATDGAGGVSVLVSSPTGVYLFNTTTGTWLTTSGGALANGWFPAGAYGAAFSPNFVGDGTVFALVDTGTYLIVRSFVVNGNGWNGDIADTAAPSGFSTAPAYVYAPSYVSFAFPSYGFVPGSSSTGKVFVSYSNGSIGYVVRVNTKTQNTSRTLTSTVTDLQIGSVAPFSLDFKGAYNTGTLAVGLVNDPTVYNISGAGTATSNFSWYACTQPPYASYITLPNTKVKFSPTSTTLYAGTAGVSGSALSVSTDYNSFAGMAFISVSSLSNVSLPSGGRTGVGSATEWQKMLDNLGTTATSDDRYLYFKSVDSGATWRLVFSSFYSYSFYPSPAYATDSTIYLVASPASSKLVKSVDGGATWNTVNVVGSLAPNCFAPIDGTNYWVATTAGIRASNSATTVYLDGYSPMVIFNLPGLLAVWEQNVELWVSTNNGATFAPTGAADALGSPRFIYLSFNGNHWTIYSTNLSGDILSYTVGVSTNWSIFKTASAMAAAGFNAGTYGINILAYTGNGIWYLVSRGNPAGQVWRSVDLSTFEALPGSAPSAMGGNIISGIYYLSSTSGMHLFTCVLGSASAANYANTWMSFTDSAVFTTQTTVANFNVKLQGGSRPDSGWVIPVTVKLFTPGADVLTAVPLYTFNPTTSLSGGNAVAQVAAIPTGTYDVSLASPHCLINVKRGVSIGASSNNIDMGTLLEGNANDDNVINIQDFGVLAGTYGKSTGAAGFDARADFDRNGTINIADFGLLAANYSKIAPLTVSTVSAASLAGTDWRAALNGQFASFSEINGEIPE